MANFIILGPHQSFLISRFPVGSSRPHIRTVTTLTSLGYYIHLSRTQHQQYINELPFEPFLLISSYLPLVIVLRPYFCWHSLAIAFMRLWFHIFCTMLYESRVRSKHYERWICWLRKQHLWTKRISKRNRILLRATASTTCVSTFQQKYRSLRQIIPSMYSGNL